MSLRSTASSTSRYLSDDNISTPESTSSESSGQTQQITAMSSNTIIDVKATVAKQDGGTTSEILDRTAEVPVESEVNKDTAASTNVKDDVQTKTACPSLRVRACRQPSHLKAKPKKAKVAKRSAARKPLARRISEEGTDSSESGDDSSSSEGFTSSSSSAGSSSSSDDGKKRRRRRMRRALDAAKAIVKKARKAKLLKDKRRRKAKEEEESTSDDDLSTSYDSDETLSEEEEEETPTPEKKKSGNNRKVSISAEKSDADGGKGSTAATVELMRAQIREMEVQLGQIEMAAGMARRRSSAVSSISMASMPKSSMSRAAVPIPLPTSASTTSKKSAAEKKANVTKYKRVDQLWDKDTHNFVFKESAEEDDTEFAEFPFLVRRKFDWENKYQSTTVDIKSNQLRAVLQEVMKDCKSISLETAEPHIDPNVLFLYLEELRTYYKKTLKKKIQKASKKKIIRNFEQQRALCKLLVGYLDQDYAETKKTLEPLLAAGNITFELMWALFKPNEIAITSSYGQWNEPRCFKVSYAYHHASMMRGEWYGIVGKYLEYDGKSFGWGDFEDDVMSFKGPRKITSLSTYPLRYHKDPEGMRKTIIERGRKFVGMEGMQYKFHKGIAFMKKKKQVLKVNINGRVMIDPGTFRRINANYPISQIKAKENDFDDSEDEDDCCCHGSDSEAGSEDGDVPNNGSLSAPKHKYRWTTADDGTLLYVAYEVDEDGEEIPDNGIDCLAVNPELKKLRFTEAQLLLTSSVVLGFAFSEKLWLEFSISGVQDITYNDKAFDSLVLPPDQKSTIHALVKSHKFHGARTIDDVVQGKGKGLVAVLHGPPGTGKTLTAEGISELLRCPLYMVSAGELGTDPSRLEAELQRILDVAHSWGAVLLLDEADVFLTRREAHDLHRNALVSIFLRLLEYFQGILILTTNRVYDFDDAFHSRIHLALKYAPLTPKARRSVWHMFVESVRKLDTSQRDEKASTDGDDVAVPPVTELTDADYDWLSRKTLNGRQIKNLVRTAQALALNEETTLSMSHIRRVLDVAESFDRDLKGGTGYTEAMRSYT